jgi:formylglycine-generating enzyme required for sulfatase activity
VINVSWDDIQSYVQWLSGKTGKNYRLLSEAEWEYAARAGTTTPFHTGSRITTDQANFDGNYTYNGSSKGQYRKRTVAVGSFSANRFGLHDMHGNVWEWVGDCWNGNYDGAPTNSSVWNSGDCSRRVLRGGSWYFKPRNMRSAIRYRLTTGKRIDIIGFRIARTFF